MPQGMTLCESNLREYAEHRAIRFRKFRARKGQATPFHACGEQQAKRPISEAHGPTIGGARIEQALRIVKLEGEIQELKACLAKVIAEFSECDKYDELSARTLPNASLLKMAPDSPPREWYDSEQEEKFWVD